MTAGVSRRAIVAGVAVGVSGVVEGDNIPVAGAGVAVAACSRPVPNWFFVAVRAEWIEGVVDDNGKPGEGGVAARALPFIMLSGSGMAGFAITGAGVVARGVLPSIHLMAGVAVIAVVVIGFLIAMAVDAVQVAQMVENVLAPICSVVAG